MKTTWNKQSEIKRSWYVVDMDGVVLGRAATRIASLLIGKGKVDAVPNMDCGDFVIVLNSDKLKVTGKKMEKKMYYRHTGFPKGFREERLVDVMNKDSRKVVHAAVKNMLPNNKLRARMITRLNIYKDDQHPHEAQKPEEVKFKK